MPHYRIYILDNEGRIVSGTDAEFEDDTAAVVTVRLNLLHHAGAEIWSGKRFIAAIPRHPTP
jgi:hypothetical protein